MKNFMMTTATALILGTTAYGESHMAAFPEMTFDATQNLNASELIGKRVYVSETKMDASMAIAEGGEKEWDDIGEINEIVLNRNGDVVSVIVGVGGLAGIGEKDVAIDMSQLQFVQEEGEAEDYFLVVNASVAAVGDAPAYGSADTAMKAETKATDDAAMTKPADTEVNTEANAEATTEATAEANTNVAAKDESQSMMAPGIERDGYQPVMVKDLTAEDLTGARVYGLNDEDVGEISELVLTDAGMVEKAVIDVGGFLGLGEKPVAVAMDELTIIRNADGDDLRVYIDSTEESLKARPEYEG